MLKRKVGIMGGTFNPIHYGHLILAETALNQFQLDEILVMPTKAPAYKIVDTKEEDRVNMVKMAIESNPHFKFSDVELLRQGYTYTVDTLKSLTNMEKDIVYYFIMGADSFFELEKWKEPAEILKLAVILVAIRDDIDQTDINKKIKYMKDKYKANIQLLNAPYMQISSHDIRSRIKDNRSIRYLLPVEVEKYIHEQELYKR